MTGEKTTVEGSTEHTNENLIHGKTTKIEMDDGRVSLFFTYEGEEDSLTNFKRLPDTWNGLEDGKELVCYRSEDGFEHAWRWEDLVNNTRLYKTEVPDGEVVTSKELLSAFRIDPMKDVQYKHTEVCPECNEQLVETTGEMPAGIVLYDYDDIDKEEFENGVLTPRGTETICVDCA